MKRYDVVINGTATTLLLSEEDAKARGLPAPEPVPTKARTPANKSRRAPNKEA